MRIERTAAGYHAEVLDSPSGQASADFVLPFSDLELENYLLKMGGARRGTRRIDSLDMEAAKAFGGRLFDAVFIGDVRSALAASLNESERQKMGLRVRLRLADAPDLADLPWEYLYNRTLNRFFSLSVKTPLVRYLDLPERIVPLAVTPPLNVLVMISSPVDFELLDVEGEFSKLKSALKDIEARGLVVLERVSEASLAALQACLQVKQYHIFHFIGHGGFDERTQDGVLILEDSERRGRRVGAQYLGMILHDHGSLRLAILNACEGARTSRTDPFAGVAQSLVQQGIPAVIAMQFEITDEAAITISQEFYASLASGYPVDGALAEARKAVFAQGNELEWGTPVLYMRSPNGAIFDVQQTEELSGPPAVSAPYPMRAARLIARLRARAANNPRLGYPGGVAVFLLSLAVLLAAFAAAGLLPFLPIAERSAIVLEDSFDAPNLNTSRWVLENDIDNIASVSEGIFRMTSSGDRYPYVSNRSPLSLPGEFRVTLRYRYTGVSVCGAGIGLTSAFVPIHLQEQTVNVEEPDPNNKLVLFIWHEVVWYETIQTGRRLIPLPGAFTDLHEVTIAYRGNRYSISQDGTLLFTSEPNPARPRYVAFGNAGIQTNTCPWDSLEIDYVKVENAP